MSDTARTPRDVRSRYCLFKTDVSDREWAILADQLDTMIVQLSNYFKQPPQGPIQGFIVRDLSQWPADVLAEPIGVHKIAAGAGVCFGQRLGRRASATVYAAAKRGVIQHEVTHAYCVMAFGSTGDTWLSEGVAELGNYWTRDRNGVEITPQVLAYLRTERQRKPLSRILASGDQPAGDWRDYAWRWSICHLLAQSPNYPDRFQQLAIASMTGRQDATFDAAFKPVSKRIAFEYDQFLRACENNSL